MPKEKFRKTRIGSRGLLSLGTLSPDASIIEIDSYKAREQDLPDISFISTLRAPSNRSSATTPRQASKSPRAKSTDSASLLGSARRNSRSTSALVAPTSYLQQPQQQAQQQQAQFESREALPQQSASVDIDGFTNTNQVLVASAYPNKQDGIDNDKSLAANKISPQIVPENDQRCLQNKPSAPQDGYDLQHLKDTHYCELENICIQIKEITDKFGIYWFQNPSGKSVPSDIASGLSSVRNELKRQVEIINALTKDVDDLKTTAAQSDSENREIVAHLQEKLLSSRNEAKLNSVNFEDTLVKLKFDMQTYRNQANELTIENEILVAQNKQLVHDMDKMTRQILEFPRKEEQIQRNAEKAIRLKSQAFRQEDAKIRMLLLDLKEMGYWKSQVTKLEKEVQRWKENAKAHHSKEATAKPARVRPSTAPSSRDPPAAEPSLAANRVSIGGTRHVPSSSPPPAAYTANHLKSLEEANEMQSMKLRHLAQALALARAYPLLQQRASDRESLQEILRENSHPAATTAPVKIYTDNDYELYEDSSIVGMDDDELQTAIENRKADLLSEIDEKHRTREDAATRRFMSEEEKMIRSIRETKSFANKAPF